MPPRHTSEPSETGPRLKVLGDTGNSLRPNTNLTTVLKLQGTVSRRPIVNNPAKLNNNRTNL